jgi:alkaline phosphatase
MQVPARKVAECPPLMRLGALALLISLGGTAYAAPTIRVTPPDGARFLPDQRFDVRVDVEDATPAANAVHTSNRGFGTGICDQYLDESELPPLPGLDPPGAHRGSGLQVLMVEGAHIDKQSHLMDPERAIFDTIEFDNAIRKCAEFAQRVGDTTVIITSDHECGGFSIIGAAIPTTSELRAMTGKDPLQKAVGTYDAAGFPHCTVDANGYPIDPDADHKILIGFGANADRNESWLARPLPVIDSLLAADIVAELKAGGTATKGAGYPVDPIGRDKDKQFLIIGQVPGTQAVHTASDIPINALGIGAAQFVGVQDNTDVFFKLVRSVLGGY